MINNASNPLCVDLDGTLITTDLLLESCFALLKLNIFYIFLILFWLLKGKAYLKKKIACRVDLPADLLPYHSDFLDYLKEEHTKGRRLILASASNEKYVNAIAEHLGIFHNIFSSNATVNLSGNRKLQCLQDFLSDRKFDYAGNAREDLVLWHKADKAVLVNPGRGVKEEVEREKIIINQVFDNRKESIFLGYIRAMRLHQWLKNLLIFVPLLMAHRFTDPTLLGRAVIAFLAFCMCASSVYVLNDLLDLPDDRKHPSKQNRPFAAGTLSIVHGVILIPMLLGIAFGLAALLRIEFFYMLLSYYIITLAYSLRLKRAALIDVIVLAGLYTIRIIAGGVAVTVENSFWLLVFSMFTFLSLALAKRYTELLPLQNRNNSFNRGYNTTDTETLFQFGCCSAYMAVLILALYINSEAVRNLYAHPKIIWLLCPLLLYMMTRIWLLARRNELHEDPVVFMIQDRRSQLLAVVGAILLWLAA